MVRHAAICALALAISLGQGTARAATVEAGESYDLLFREGTLDDLRPEAALVYRREVTSALNPAAEARDTGTVVLQRAETGEAMARLEFRQGERHRGLGTFPASVGNPMIMYFYETAVRDMAEATGGSPFYIRNRIKAALTRPAEIETGEAMHEGRAVPTTTIALRPFAGDPNRARMGGFGNLVLRVTMSEDVPGWYLSLVAEAAGEDGPLYRSALVFDGVESLP